MLNHLGLHHVWCNQSTFSINRLKFVITQKIENEYIQLWKRRKIYSPKLEFYNKVTRNYKTESYLLNTDEPKYTQALCKLRISAHDLKIEKGRYNGTPRNKRICEKCNTLEDEIHFLDHCTKYNSLRKSLIDGAIKINPTCMIPSDLLLKDDLQCLLAKYVYNCFNMKECVTV